MNEVLQAIFDRRSIRKYKDIPVAHEHLDLILKAGQAAASAMNQQPWFFVAVTRKDLIEQIGGLLSEDRDPYYGAPLLILVFSDSKAYSPVTDAALAIGNMMLAAHSLGLGSCWIDYSKVLFSHKEFSQLATSLGVPEGYFCVGSMIAGTPDETREAHKIRPETMSIVG